MAKRLPPIAKITPPCIGEAYHRARLFRMLDRYAEQPVTWISGPAGSGKTTLAASYLQARNLPCLWYRLDEGDGDIATFFYYMGMAVRESSPAAHSSLPQLTSEYREGIPIFSRRYFEALYSRLKSPFVMVFDNYHEVATDSPFQEIVHTGLSCIPRGIRVMVLSRNKPPAAFIRLRADRMCNLGWKDLRFTEDESKEAVRLREDRALDGKTYSLLFQKTRGWAAGLVLLIECARSGNMDYQSFEALTPEEIFDFFSVEIFHKAPPEIRDFLLKTAFLPAMTAEMTIKLTGIHSAASLLSHLERNHFFLEKHQKTDPVYCYHPLFREFLISETGEHLNQNEIALIRHEAALLLRDAGQAEEAARLWIDARDWNRFVPFVRERAPFLLTQGRRATLHLWLEAIPRNMVRIDPWLLYWRGISRLGFADAGSLDDFKQSFHLFEAGLNTAGALMAWSGIIQAIFIDFDDFRLLDPWIDWLHRKIRPDCAFPSREVEINVCTSVIVALLHRRPDHPHLRTWLERTLPLSPGIENTIAHMPTYPFFAIYYLYLGEFDACAVVVRQMYRRMHSHMASPLLTITFKLINALMCTTSPQLHDEGLHAVTAGLNLARRTGASQLDPLLLGVGVQNALNAMNLSRAAWFLDKMETALQCSCRGHACYYLYLSAWYHLCAGNPSRAVILGEESLRVMEATGLAFPEPDCRIMLAIAYYETGTFSKTRFQLDRVGTLARKTYSAYLEYRFHLLEAQIAFDQDSRDFGMTSLANALRLGRQKGFFTMVNFWRPAIMSGLCAKALQAGIEVEHVRSLIFSLNLNPDPLGLGMDRWPWPVRIITLGCFEIIRNGKKLEFSSKTPHKLLSLLQALVSCGPKGANEEHLADLLWPDADGDTALKSLGISIHRLRKLLGDNKLVRLREGRVKLTAEHCLIDAHAFEILLDRAEEMFSSNQRHSHCQNRTAEAWWLIESAVGIYRGHFLAGVSSPWALAYGEHLKSRFFQTVIRLGEFCEGEGRHSEAIRWYRKGLEIDNGTEAFYRGLMRCHLAIGRHSEALTIYHRCKKTMHALFGVNPSREMEDLFKQLTS